MGKKCLKCGYERKPLEIAPDYECPKCGVIYDKTNTSGSEKTSSKKSKKQLWFETAIALIFGAIVFTFLLLGNDNDSSQSNYDSSMERKAYFLVVNHGQSGYTIGNQMDGLVGIERAQGKKCEIIAKTPTFLSSGVYEVRVVISVEGEGEYEYKWKASLNNNSIVPLNTLTKQLSY